MNNIDETVTVLQLLYEAAGVPIEYVVDGSSIPEPRCTKCRAPQARLAMGLCSECFSNLSAKADSYGGTEVEKFERFMELWRSSVA
jgi:predicted amidophosphoribosyltransferase